MTGSLTGSAAAALAQRILPVLVVPSAHRAEPLARALLAGGLSSAEVTLRTADALDSIAAMAAVPGLTVGAGTVRTAAQVDDAAAAGAQFLVSPGLSAEVVRRARELDLTLVPGVITPSEVMAAVDWGLTTLKFFPAASAGGPGAVAALGAPFADVTFVPTGGITSESAASYLALPNVAAVGGSWMAPADLVTAGDWDAVADRARAAVQAAQA